jgi:transcriptional regulator with XRE-family HTH domain
MLMTNLEEIFITNLKRYRDKAGLTQAKLGELAGHGQKYVAAVEGGLRFPSPEGIESLSKALGIEPYQLLLDPNAPDINDPEIVINEFGEMLSDEMRNMVEEMKPRYFAKRKSEK